MDRIKVGILKETKTPPDRRVAIPPQQALELLQKFQNVDLVIQKSDLRAYSDQEYLDLNLKMVDDISDCDILLGVKEVDLSTLIANKTYLIFSHTAKKQKHNHGLLKATVEKNIRLIDYEFLTNEHGVRLVAFGRWAGIVGAYNTILGYGKLKNIYALQRAHECHDMDEFFAELDKVKLPNCRILITGGGRVAHGAMEVLDHIGIKKVSPQNYLKNQYNEPVYTQIEPWHYTQRIDGDVFDLEHFAKHPNEYESTFLPFTRNTDIYLACHFWDPESPVFMTQEHMQAPDFKIEMIGDISCDVNGPIPSTLRASTIENPFYGYNAQTGQESTAFEEKTITVMAVDNLPGEAPRNASVSFADDLINKVLPSLFGKDKDDIIKRATIAKNGKLTKRFAYLQDFLDGK